MRCLTSLALFAALGAASSYVAVAQTEPRSFVSIDYPEAVATFAYGINNAGQIVGAYLNSQGAQHGFLRTVDGKFLDIAFPGFKHTVVYSISNSGKISGFYSNSDSGGGDEHGFTGGVSDPTNLTSFNYPAAGVTDTVLTSISPNGTILGFYDLPPSSAFDVGFLCNSAGFCEDFHGPTGQSSGAIPTAMNVLGQVSGFYAISPGLNHAFLRSADGLSFQAIYCDNPNGNARAFGVNAGGQVVGYCGPEEIAVGYLRQPDGTMESIRFPSAVGTYLAGINDFGVISGSYLDAGGTAHGFMATKILPNAADVKAVFTGVDAIISTFPQLPPMTSYRDFLGKLGFRVRDVTPNVDNNDAHSCAGIQGQCTAIQQRGCELYMAPRWPQFSDQPEYLCDLVTKLSMFCRQTADSSCGGGGKYGGK